MSKAPQTLGDAARFDIKRRGIWSDQGLDDVESLMLQMCSGPRLDRLGAITAEHLATGGKRLRARLALGAIEAMGGDRDAGIGWAAACELLHNATLIHDDVQDGDRFRRGKTSAWVKHGVSQAITAGDLLLMLPYAVLDHLWCSDAVKWQLARILAHNASSVARGQASETDLITLGKLDWEAYAVASEGKTAALLGMPVEGAAVLAGHTPEQASALAEPFRRIGVLFQVQDDVLDLYGDKGRDVIGSDLYEGKVSALVVEHLRLHPHDRGELMALLRTPRDETPATAVAWWIRRFRESGALDAVWDRLADLEDEVENAPALRYQRRLRAVAQALVARAISPIAHTAPKQEVG